MDSNNSFIVQDEKGVRYVANILTVLEIDGNDYVIYNIENDINTSNVYVLKMLVDEYGNNVFVSINDKVEKIKVFDVVDKMINDSYKKKG